MKYISGTDKDFESEFKLYQETIRDLDVTPILTILILLDLKVSSAPSERNHSATRHLIKPQRSSLSPELIKMIRFIQHNLRFFYPQFFDD